MRINRNDWLASLAAMLTLTAAANATIPYSPVTMGAGFTIGPGFASPNEVFGKEYSHDFDHTTMGAGGAPDPQQIVQWDGSGGTTDGLDFSGTRPNWRPEQEIDAIAHHNDLFFQDLRSDASHLLFTHDDEISFITPGGPVAGSVPAVGPVPLSNGMVIGGAGEVSIETAGMFSPPESQGVWATQSEVNGMPLPRDVDGLEVWGPEPPADGDTDKYSLDLDFDSGVSVWNGSGSAYLAHAMIVGAVESLLGPIPGPAFLPFDNQEGQNAINLDALMVLDSFGEEGSFDRDPTGAVEGDTLIFSIRQIVDPMDPTGYYATGSELFVLDAATGASYLEHGGHVWDKDYALGSLAIEGDNGFGVIDINGIESIAGSPIPEPAGAALLTAGVFATAVLRRRKR